MAEIPPVDSPTVLAVYAGLEAARPAEDRPYLGMSGFSSDCDRSLWYGWRKAHAPEPLDGRRIRLFETGHLEEDRLVDNLRAAGVLVEPTDPATGRQFAVWNLGGHLRGHLDGRVLRVPEAPKTWHVLECKTHNDKSFKELVKSGVTASKPGHFRQMQFYMHHTGLTRALYVAVNKNDDQLYTERLRYDPLAAHQLLVRAERILRADEPPARLHQDPSAPSAYACGWCPARGLCHDGWFARVHCRTCLHATAIVDEGDAGRWRCERFGLDLTFEEQMRGCDFHLFLPALVPGQQVDADEAAGTVTYQLHDGATWVDAPARRGLA